MRDSTLIGAMSTLSITDPEFPCISGCARIVRSGHTNGDGPPGFPEIHVDAFKVHIGGIDFDKL